MEAKVSEDGSTGQEGAAHTGEEMPVRPIGWAVRLRHVIGLFYHLTVYLKQRRKFDLSTNICCSIISAIFHFLMHRIKKAFSKIKSDAIPHP